MVAQPQCLGRSNVKSQRAFARRGLRSSTVITFSSPTSATHRLRRFATVYFWWADPSLGIITTANAHSVGTSSVSVPGSASNTSLELSAWTPSFVNNGHECLIAAVVEGGGPPPMVLDGANDPTVAQHNLGVINLGMHMQGRFSYPFQICNPFRTQRRFTVHAEGAPIDQAAPFLAPLRGAAYTPAKGGKNGGQVGKLGFVQVPCPHPSDFDHARPVLEDIRLEPYACTGFTLVGVVEKGDALIHVTQRIGDKIVGGLSILVLAEREDSHERRS